MADSQGDRWPVSPRAELVALAAFTMVGAFARVAGTIDAGFPLNDGGLFYQMILDLQRSWPNLPEVSTYNGIDMPYAYPPLALYIGAALEPAFGLDVMRLVPVVAATLCIPAFHLVARRLLPNILAPLAATLLFALVPRSFEWMTMGGGLTRSIGLLLALLTVWATLRMLDGAGRLVPVGAGALAGLTVLAHPQSALFIGLSGVVLLVARGVSGAVIGRGGIAVATAAIVLLPWLLVVLVRHGPDPLLSASGTQPGPFIGLLSLLSFELTGSRLFDVIGFLAAAGLLLSVLRRQWLLPAWLVLLMVLDSRGGATYASVPAALLAGRALVDLVLRPLWETRSADASRTPFAPLRKRPLNVLLTGTLVAVAVVDAFGSQLAPTWPGVALTPEQRSAMGGAAEAAPDGEFLVVSGRVWAVDATAEWFPVLSGARSAATVQGHEWRGREEFRRYLDASDELRECASSTPACLDAWSDRWEIDFTHVYLPKGSLSGALGPDDCCAGLRELLRNDPSYAVTHDSDGATIFERTDG
jgi:hypothetical protein